MSTPGDGIERKLDLAPDGQLGSDKRVLASLGVEGLRSEVGTVGPHDGRSISVDPDFGEVLGVAQGREYAFPFQARQVDVASRSVVEKKPQPMVADHGDPHYSGEVTHFIQCYGSGSTGRIGSARRARSQLASSSS